MRNKILNCQSFAFHHVTLRFSYHALSTFISPSHELTHAYRYLDHFFLKQLTFCENNRKVEFFKNIESSSRGQRKIQNLREPRPRPRSRPRTTRSRPRTSQTCPRGQGHPRGLHHCPTPKHCSPLLPPHFFLKIVYCLQYSCT